MGARMTFSVTFLLLLVALGSALMVKREDEVRYSPKHCVKKDILDNFSCDCDRARDCVGLADVRTYCLPKFLDYNCDMYISAKDGVEGDPQRHCGCCVMTKKFVCEE